MIKHYCDACGQETRSLKGISIPCHIAKENRGYVDMNLVRQGVSFKDAAVSGRTVEYGLCTICSNKVWQSAYDEIKKIKVNNNDI
jgi:hypothetical protein